MNSNEKLVSAVPCGTHTSSAIQIHLITGYRSTHDLRHLEDFQNSDVDF
jgi:hypothetical protein